MTPRQTISLLLMAALIVSGGGRREGGACGSAAGCHTPTQPEREVAAVVAGETKTAPAQIVWAAAARTRGEAAAAQELSGNGATMLAEQAAVQLVVKGAELDLTPEQWSSFAAVTGHYQTVRQAFEATIATVAGRENLRLEIPAYPAAGDALREKFYGELRVQLGEGASDMIVKRAGSMLEGYFGGFGVSVQRLDFTANPAAAGADYQVTRTARYWNSVDARETLTFRRETYFPGLEDPTGERWGPFLALLAKHGAERAGS